MKRPEPVIVSPFDDDALDHLSVAELTELQRRITDLRQQKIGAAKRELVAEYRAKAAALGLDLDEILQPASPVTKPTAKPTTDRPEKPALPPDWRERVFGCLERNEGRATSKVIHHHVWPGGASSSGSGAVLKSALGLLVHQGILIIVRPGSAGVPAIYGLASMMEAPADADAA